MTRKLYVPVVLSLLIGVVAGWATASGQFDSFVSVNQKVPSAASGRTDMPCSESVGSCCSTAGKHAGLSALVSHNTKVSANLQQSGKKPNILVIFGDDIGVPQISAYTQGLMG